MKFIVGSLFFLSFNVYANFLGSQEWFPVKGVSQIIQQESPLDFSYLVGDVEAGRFGRVSITKDGHFAFLNRLNKQQRFFCASTDLTSITGGFPSHQMAELYVKQLKMRGYNLVRIHSIEAYLMGSGERDFEFDKERLDRFFYFLSLLKREGIYWLVNGLTSGNGAYGGVKPHRWIKKYNLKAKLYYDEEAKEHWKKLITELWGEKNPYTGLSVLEDPALFGLILVNENGLNFVLRAGITKPFKKLFNDWLKEQYHTTTKLKKSWGSELSLSESLELGNVEPPKTVKERSVRQVDFQRFIQFKEKELATWQIAYLRSIGYKGLVTGYNNWYSLSASKSRSMFDWIDMHNYHDESFMWSPNFKMKQTSSLADDLKYIRHLAASAELGKPFTVSEYGHAFWNNYRYESGLVFPALASLQDWDMICQYSQGAIDLSFAPPTTKASRKKAMYAYNIGMDPVLRAGETLAALLFLRGDVAASKNLIVADFSSGKWLSGQGFDHVSDHFNELSLISKFRVNFDDVGIGYKAKASSLVEGQVFWPSIKKISKNIEEIKKKNVLDQKNRTQINTIGNVFHSDTNELLFNTSQNSFKVSTSRTIATLIIPERDTVIGGVSLKNATSNGMFALSSIDGKPIKDSSKLLIILTSNARNSGMVLSDGDRKLEKLGTFPVLIKRLSFDISFESNKAWYLSRLSLTGKVMDTRLVKLNEFIDIKIDNYSAKHGATTYFMLVEL